MPRKRPKKLSPAYLERAAVFYLERYSSSAENLRRVLDRKARRSMQEYGEPEPAEAAGWISAVLDKLQRNGLLNDQAYAEGRVRRLYAEGKALGRIRQTLAAKGVGKAAIEMALARLETESTSPVSDLPAAVSYARKRKLGPFRTDPDQRAAMRQKDMGALARRGFSHAVAAKVLGAADRNAAEELVHEQE
jgi:regulatory protein